MNTSGNVRDGEVFTLVKRDGREFHIYGTGKDRQIIGLRPKAETTTDQTPSTTDKPATTETPKTTGTGTTGSGPISDTATT